MSQRAAWLLIMLVTVGAARGEAQVDDTHQGFWISFGGGGGWLDGSRGGSAYIRMGGTPNNRVQFGGQVIAWWREDGPGLDRQREFVTATAAVFPLYPKIGERAPFREWFTRIGFGVAVAESSIGGEAEGIGIDLGTGIDLRLGRNFFVTPNVDLLIGFFRTTTDAAVVFTLGLTWH